MRGAAGAVRIRSRADCLIRCHAGPSNHASFWKPNVRASPGARSAAISASRHTDIVHQARDAFVAELGRSGVAAEAVEHFDVPGAFEIPLLARRLAESGHYDAIVAFGLVVNGGAYRHDFVATAVIDGLMRVQLDSGVPVLSAVLTPHQFHEHATHREWFTAHFVIKGQEAARATLQTVALHQRVSTLTAR